MVNIEKINVNNYVNKERLYKKYMQKKRGVSPSVINY